MDGARRSQSSLPPDLRRWAAEIERDARARGLDFFELDFRWLDAADVNGLAAYGGFPVRAPSWRFGMEYERLTKSHAWGLSRIYELVINTDPVVAYLVRSNSASEQKLVMAHVCGHADFFRHNAWFAATDRKMLDTLAQHAVRVRREIERQGIERVERFLDLCLSLDTLVDPYDELRRSLRKSAASHAVAAPTYDVLGFLAESAPLEDWERELLSQVRAEARYFLPQRLTRIMNEGWASFWHSRLLTEGVLDSSEIIDFADCHSGATQQAPGRLNPYKLGIELWRHAEARGEDLFRLRRVHNDASFVDLLLDDEFVARNAMFVHQKNARTGKQEIADRSAAKVRERLLSQLAWGGLPRIELSGVGEARVLELVHRHDGRDLDLQKASDTLQRIAALWKGPVRLGTRLEGVAKRLTWSDGALEIEDLAEATPDPA